MEVDQTSTSASKPTTFSQAVNLDPPHPRPRPTSQSAEAMEVDYGPALPPPSKVASVRPKNILTLAKGMTLNRGLPRITIQVSPRNLGLPHLDPKSMLIKVNKKVRSRYLSSSSEEDKSSAPKHWSSKPSGPLSDQDQPQHDLDPPYYREVALFDIPSQYAEEVDTFRRIFSLPDPRESMPRSGAQA